VALLPKYPKKAGAIAKSLKLSKKLHKAIVERIPAQANVGTQPNPGLFQDVDNIRALAYRTSVATARDVALLFADDAALPAMLARLQSWQPPIFPLTGGDLIERGLKPGPIVARTLATIEQAWIDKDFPDKKWVTEFVDTLDFTRRT
jgi:poly(A) polymerase